MSVDLTVQDILEAVYTHFGKYWYLYASHDEIMTPKKVACCLIQRHVIPVREEVARLMGVSRSFVQYYPELEKHINEIEVKLGVVKN
jgi:hypothetical protein